MSLDFDKSYKVLHELGKGGYATVNLCLEIATRRTFAVKMPLKNLKERKLKVTICILFLLRHQCLNENSTDL